MAPRAPTTTGATVQEERYGLRLKTRALVCWEGFATLWCQNCSLLRRRPVPLKNLERGDTVQQLELAPACQPKTPKDRATLLRRSTSVVGSQRAVDTGRVIWDTSVRDRYFFAEDQALGKGSFGVVRTATDIRTREKRALKSAQLLGERGMMREEQQAIFLAEAEVHLKCDHPHICKLLEVYIDEDSCHLVLELCTGSDLLTRLTNSGTYTEPEAATAVTQMLSALAYLHSHHICHRDLKLENWMYKDRSVHSKLKLIDFGFSAVLSEDLRFTAVLGTIYYMAPEVLEGCYDHKCDVWSTGIILYMLLCGELPFSDAHCTDWTINQILSDPVCMEGSDWDGISDRGKDFVHLLLQRDIRARPNAQEAARHCWLKNGEAGCHDIAQPISRKVLQSLHNFGTMNAIKRAVCGLIAFSMSVSETDELESEFKKLDKDGSGTIKMHALVDTLAELLGMSHEEGTKLFGRLDLTEDKELVYSEFLAAAAQQRFWSQESVIRETFQRLDVDNTGYISLDNLRQVFGDEFNGTRVEDIIEEVDVKNNGCIDYEEFVIALMDLGSANLRRSESHPELTNKISRAFEFTSVGSKPRTRDRAQTDAVAGLPSSIPRMHSKDVSSRSFSSPSGTPAQFDDESGHSVASTPCAALKSSTAETVSEKHFEDMLPRRFTTD